MLEIKKLVKVYKTKGGVEVKALDNVSVKFPETGMVFLLGKSGSGKSTLLNVSGGLDKPDSGEIIIKGRNSKDFSGADFDSYRNTYIGFIFQEYNILNEFNISENIELALQLQGKKSDKEAVDNLLKQVDLVGLGKRKPNTLSGGQKQRVAIARALIKNPEIIMADEPTGALDSNTGKQVFDTLKKLSKEKLVIIVSHDRDFAEIYADRIIELADGKVISDVTKAHVEPKEVTENINMINDNVLSIKNVDDLKKEDMAKIYELLKTQKGEVIITSNEKNLKTVKQAIHISEDNKSEVFNETKEIDVKEYNGKETKFIKSHLPFSRAFKIGASSIKSRPGRMVLTVLLTIIALVMFGVASTLMLYNPTYSVSAALAESPNDYEQIEKKYKVKKYYHNYNIETGEDKIDSDERYEQTYFTSEEIEELNRTSNLKFAGVITFGSYDAPVRFSELSTKGRYYSQNGLSGLIDAKEEYLTNIGGAIIAGKYPENSDELLVSEYVYELFKEDTGLKIKSYEDLIYSDTKNNTVNVTLYSNGGSLQRQKFKIVGIFSIGVIPQEFTILKEENPNLSQKELESLITKYQMYITKSYHLIGFVSPDFYDTYIESLSQNSSGSLNYINGIGVRGVLLNNYPIEYDVNYDSYQNVLTPKLEPLMKNIKAYDLNGNIINYVAPKENEVYISYRRYQEYIRELERIKIEHAREVINNYGLSEYTYNLFKDSNKQKEYSNYIDEYYNGSLTKANKDKLFDLIDNYYPKIAKISYVLRNASYYNDQYMNEGYDYENESYQAFMNDYTTLQNTYYSDQNTVYNNRALIDELYVKVNIYLSNNKELILHHDIYDKVNELINKKNMSASHDEALRNLIYNYDRYSIPADNYNQALVIINEYDTLKEYDVNNYEDNKGLEIACYYKNSRGSSGKMKVIGYYSIDESEVPYYLVSDEFINSNGTIDSKTIYYNTTETEYVKPTSTKYSRLITKTNFSQNDIKILLKDSGIYKYNMTNTLYQTLENIIDLISTLKTIFLIVGIAFGVFAALMLFNFISSSINSKIREIGILRAVGARGSDLFKIFFSESGLVSLICTVLSIAFAIIVCWYMNRELSENLGFKVLNFGLINIGIIIVGALLIALIGTFIPVFRASKRQPVDSIRTL